MLQTILLLLVQIGGVYITVKNMKGQSFPIKEFLGLLYAVGIAVPFLEEALFRSVCKQYLSGFVYSDVINAVLFGLAHAHNYILHKNIWMTLLQMITTTYLGYFLVQFDSFIHAYLVHVYYNSAMLLCSNLIVYLMNRNKPQEDKKTIGLICCSIRCPNKSVDDNTKHRVNYKYISRNKVNKDMLERMDKLDEHMNKKFSWLYKNGTAECITCE